MAVKKQPAGAKDARDASSVPGLRRSPGEGNDNALQYSCLENPMDRGAWQAIVHGVAKSRTRLSDWSHYTQALRKKKKTWPCEHSNCKRAQSGTGSTRARKRAQSSGDRRGPAQHSACLRVRFLEEENQRKDFKKYGLK